MNFIDKRISVKRTADMLAKNGIGVDENEVSVILDFLYLIAKTYNKNNDGRTDPNLKEKSNKLKTAQNLPQA